MLPQEQVKQLIALSSPWGATMVDAMCCSKCINVHGGCDSEESHQDPVKPIPRVCEEPLWEEPNGNGSPRSTPLPPGPPSARSTPPTQPPPPPCNEDTTEAFQAAHQIVEGQEYGVVLQRLENMPIGLQFYADSIAEASGIVNEVMEGSLRATEVRKGDRLVAVNEKRGTFENMMKVLREEKCLTMKFKRPKDFVISVVKDGELGVQLAMSRDCDFVLIKSINDSGAIPELNRAYSDRGIRQLDCIIEVNGFRGPCIQMLQRIQEAQELKLRMLRYYSKVELNAILANTVSIGGTRLGGA